MWQVEAWRMTCEELVIQRVPKKDLPRGPVCIKKSDIIAPIIATFEEVESLGSKSEDGDND